MKQILSLLFAFLFFAAIWGPSPASAKKTFMSKSIHDFGRGQDACTICHLVTPITGREFKPVWNQTASMNTFGFYSSRQTYVGTRLPSNIGSFQSLSNICLSCHDGSSAKRMNVGGFKTNSISKNGDLSGNHPVGIPYPDRPRASYNGIISNAKPDGYVRNPSQVKLFGDRPGRKGIECSSCHDIHQATNTKYMLRDSTGTLCIRCHIK